MSARVRTGRNKDHSQQVMRAISEGNLQQPATYKGLLQHTVLEKRLGRIETYKTRSTNILYVASGGHQAHQIPFQLFQILY